MRGQQMDKRHVLVDRELEDAVIHAVQGPSGTGKCRGREKVRCKMRSQIPIGFAAEAVDAGFEFITSRTFIDIKIGTSSMRSAPSSGPVTVSTTDAHGGLNPRAA